MKFIFVNFILYVLKFVYLICKFVKPNKINTYQICILKLKDSDIDIVTNKYTRNKNMCKCLKIRTF